MPIMGSLSELEELRKRDLLSQRLATDPFLQQELLKNETNQKQITTKLKKQSRIKLLKKQLAQNPELRSLLQYSTLSLEDI